MPCHINCLIRYDVTVNIFELLSLVKLVLPNLDQKWQSYFHLALLEYSKPIADMSCSKSIYIEIAENAHFD